MPVVVYRRRAGTWSLSQVINPPPDAAGYLFGSSLALRGIDLAIGAPVRNDDVRGSVFVFQESAGTYTLAQRLVSPGDLRTSFGASVVFTDDLLVVGSPSGGFLGDGAGFAATYGKSEGRWLLGQVLRPSDAPQQSFGWAIASGGDQVFASAIVSPTFTNGAVYAFGPSVSDIGLAMTVSPGVANQGDAVTIGLSVTNHGATTLNGVGAAVSFGSALIGPTSGECVGTTEAASCSFGTLAPGMTAAAQLVGIARMAGTFGLVGAVPGGPAVQHALTVQPSSADVSITMTSVLGTVRPRPGFLGYALTVRNNGPGTATGLLVNLETSPGLFFAEGFCGDERRLPCTIPSLAAGASAGISVDYDIPPNYAGTEIVATATVSAANPDPLPTNNTASFTNQVQNPLSSSRRFHPVTPCRLFDTRTLDGPLPRNPGPATYRVAGGCGISAEAGALAVNVTVTEPTMAGHLKVYPAGDAASPSSFINYGAGQTRANSGIVGLNGGSSFMVDVNQASGSAHVIIDVFGYFR
jgi:hypothetical protein